MAEKTYTGTCFCGAIELSVSGEPVAMGYCHCASCRTWAAAPVNAFSLWKASNVTVTRGEGNLGEFHKSPQSQRKFCRTCGGHVMTAHPPWDLIDVYAEVLAELPFAPTIHLHYGEKTLALRDGLPKFKDVPKRMGGSGETLPE